MKKGNSVKFKHFVIMNNKCIDTIFKGIVIDFCTDGIKITSDEFTYGKWISKENVIEVIN